MEFTQEEKAARLQWAVINSSLEELSKECEELGYVEMSAPALGLACRFRGLDVVKCLVNAGASFDFPSTEEAGETYHCYAGTEKRRLPHELFRVLIEGIWKESGPAALLPDGHGNGTADGKGGWQPADISS